MTQTSNKFKPKDTTYSSESDLLEDYRYPCYGKNAGDGKFNKRVVNRRLRRSYKQDAKNQARGD